MTKGLKDPVTGKVYKYKGFVPTKSITPQCKADSHDSCWSVPQELADRHGIDFAKKNCCLCPCHGLYEEVSE
jgi:hypothetical protein